MERWSPLITRRFLLTCFREANAGLEPLRQCSDDLCSSNLATYASLFGMSWLEPIMWKLQQWLYSKYAPSRQTSGVAP